MTNLGWTVDGDALSSELFGGAEGAVAVLNDFEAAGYGVAALVGEANAAAREDNTLVVHAAEAVEGAPVAVLGPGTGERARERRARVQSACACACARGRL